MTRVLVVHHDTDVADNEADYLRRAGFEVSQCAGPTQGPCPVHAGLPCVAVEAADVLVYDVWASGESDGGRSLVSGLRNLHGDIPIVLTSAGMEPDWMTPPLDVGVVVLDGAPSGAELVSAIHTALGSVSAQAAGT